MTVLEAMTQNRRGQAIPLGWRLVLAMARPETAGTFAVFVIFIAA